MDGASSAGPGDHIALAVAAGSLATKTEAAAAAVRDRYGALERAIARKSADIDLKAVAGEPASVEHRAALAKDLEKHGAAKERDVVTTARELLGLIKVDDAARAAVEPMFAEVETALVALAEIDLDADKASGAGKAAEAKPADPGAKKTPAPKPRDPAESARDVRPPTTSRRLIPPDEPSKTELERTALPFWQRTDRFFTKGLILVGAYALAMAIYWFFIRTPPNATMKRCLDGEKPACWEVVASEDTMGEGHEVSPEPLRILCEKHQDPCACAGLAYVNAPQLDHSEQCNGLLKASDLDPRWPCRCTRYRFWRAGEDRTVHCGKPRCE